MSNPLADAISALNGPGHRCMPSLRKDSPTRARCKNCGQKWHRPNERARWRKERV